MRNNDTYGFKILMKGWDFLFLTVKVGGIGFCNFRWQIEGKVFVCGFVIDEETNDGLYYKKRRRNLRTELIALDDCAKTRD